jgi:alpha-N-arabinofuranosidase
VWFHTPPLDTNIEPWQIAPSQLEDIYTFEDALVVGFMMISLLKHADRVKIACLAQLVNVIAPIMTQTGGPSWKQTIFYPFMHASKYGRGTALKAIVSTPTYDCSDYENVPYIDTAAVQGDDGSVTLFCVNRDLSEDYSLSLDLRSFAGLSLKEHIMMHNDDVKAVNTAENPNNVVPCAGPGGEGSNGRFTVKLPALSWNVFRFTK